MNITGTELSLKVKEYLDSQNWKYSINDDAFQLIFSLDNKLEKCSMTIRILEFGEKGFGVHTKTTCPLAIPTEKNDKIIEFITRANYGMINGYFSYQLHEEDPDEGIIMYSTWLYCIDVCPSLKDVESSVDFPLRIMMDYGDALFNVLKLDFNPEEEIHRVEG